MSSLKVECPYCGKELEIEPEIDLIICSGCRRMFKVKIEIVLEEVRHEKIK